MKTKYLIILFGLLLTTLLLIARNNDDSTSRTDTTAPEVVLTFPTNNATGTSLNAILSWECSDSDGDELTYDIYFGESVEPLVVSSSQAETIYNPETLTVETTYYWKIIASDSVFETESNIWSFTTRTASDPSEMIFVQGGTFQMGDRFDEGEGNELPLHNVTLDDFYMGATEVTNQQVIDVFNWANSQGYINCSTSTVTNAQGNSQELFGGCPISWNGSALVFDGSLLALTADCPSIEITWYGAIAYANYLSLQEGLTVFYDLSDWSCDWNANGYRLPTEAEWEYAARGGIYENNNYRYSGCHLESDLPNYAWYYANADPQTHSVGTKFPNQLGLYDMSGNVFEWCWDKYNSSYYGSSPNSNPHGPDTGSLRVIRGGGWFISATNLRVAFRSYGNYPSYSTYYIGFRLLRSSN